MKPGYFVLCADGEVNAKVIGPFETRDDALAELTITQRNQLMRCELNHIVIPANKAPRTVQRVDPVTTETERRQQQARTAAMRSSR